MPTTIPAAWAALLFLLSGTAVFARTFPIVDKDIEATYYYDIGHEGACEEVQGVNWSVGIVQGPTACEQAPHIKNLAQLNSNRIVAIRNDLFGDDKASICGNEVKVYDVSGEEIVLDEGPFYVWDRCLGCDTNTSPTGLNRIDLSTKALLQLNNGSCNNPRGVRYEILENKVRSWPWDGSEPAEPAAGQAQTPKETPSLNSGAVLVAVQSTEAPSTPTGVATEPTEDLSDVPSSSSSSTSTSTLDSTATDSAASEDSEDTASESATDSAVAATTATGRPPRCKRMIRRRDGRRLVPAGVMSE